MQREKLQGNGKAQLGLMQVGDIKIIETASQAQEKRNSRVLSHFGIHFTNIISNFLIFSIKLFAGLD